jgi:hypothetical protein
MEIIGYTGAFLLAICALPQAIMSLVNGHSIGLSHTFLLSWLTGEILMLFFTYKLMGPHGPLFYNYLVNTILLLIITKYRYFPRGSKMTTWAADIKKWLDEE